MWEGGRGARVCTRGPIGAICRIYDRWGWRRVEYRGWGWGGEWVERILQRRRASAVGLLQWTVIRVWLSIVWIRGSGAGVWQVSVIVVSVLGLVGLTKLGSESGTERRKEIKEPLDSETWEKERMALVKDCVLFW